MALVCTLPTLTDWTPIELAVADKTAANYSRTLPAWLSVFLYVCISSQSSLLPSSRPIASRLSNLSSPKTEDTQFALFSESASFHLFLLPVTRHNLPLASLPLQHTDTLSFLLFWRILMTAMLLWAAVVAVAVLWNFRFRFYLFSCVASSPSFFLAAVSGVSISWGHCKWKCSI